MGKALGDATHVQNKAKDKKAQYMDKPKTNQTKNSCTPLYSALNSKNTYHLLLLFLISILGLAQEKTLNKVK